jgi:hypothetical protein
VPEAKGEAVEDSETLGTPGVQAKGEVVWGKAAVVEVGEEEEKGVVGVVGPRAFGEFITVAIAAEGGDGGDERDSLATVCLTC